MRMALNWLKQENVEKYTLSAEGAGIVAFPQRYTDELAAVKQYLKVIQAGVLTGEVKGERFDSRSCAGDERYALAAGCF